MNAVSMTQQPAPMSSVYALITSLIKSVPNEEFGVIARWMNEESTRRRETVRAHLSPGVKVVWVNTTGRLNQGEVVELGAKNAKVRSEHGGELFVPLARLELRARAEARLSSLPPETPVFPPSGPRRTTSTTLPIAMPPLAARPSVRKAKVK